MFPSNTVLRSHPTICFSPTVFSFLYSDDSKFAEAVRVLLTWVERGEVNRRNANNFYSMIQSSNSHIRRLMSEKAAHEKEMEEAKEKFKNALGGIVIQCECFFTDVASVSNPSKLLYPDSIFGHHVHFQLTRLGEILMINLLFTT